MKNCTQAHRVLLTLAALFSLLTQADAQLSGTKTIPGDYATIAAAVTDLNTQGVGAGGVTFNVAAGHTETSDIPEITASGTMANPIVFQKSGMGANPVVTRLSAGTVASSTTLGGNGDGIIVINGGDFITFDGIDIQTDPTFSGNGYMEYGFYLKKASATDACKDVTIKNCAITLNKAAIYSFGVFVSNISGTASVTVTSTGGRSENINIFSNTISNCYGGVQLRGYASASPYDLYDQNIEVGDDGGNTISNYGGGSSTTYGVYAIYQNAAKISNNSIMGGDGSTGTHYGIFVSTGNNSSFDLNNNTISITNDGTTNTVYGIVTSIGTTGNTNNTINVIGNTLTNFSRPSATSGATYFIYSTSNYPFNFNIENNIIGSSSLPSTGTIYGIGQISIPTNLNINNNTVSDITRTGTTSTSGFYGIYSTGSSTALSTTISNNTVHTLTGMGSSGTLSGIYLGTNLVSNVYKNKIYNLTSDHASGVVSGLTIISGTVTGNIYNNLIGDLKAPSTGSSTAAAPSVRGINITSTTASSALNLSYNTVYLNATSTGTNFGSTALFATISSTATSASLTLKNNIFVNLSTPNGVGLTSAYQRSNTALDNYNTASNNNLFYAGMPSATNLIFYDGTNASQALADFQALVTPRETASISETPDFLSTMGSSADFLHIDPTTATQIESGGMTVSGITTDYDGNTRNASTPDIGGDEFAGIPIDMTPPVISYTPLANTCTAGARTLTATITDATGVPTSGIGLPVLYWKINSGMYSAATAVSMGGNQYEFTFGAGSVAGDTIRYYIVAQDLVMPTPNVGASPSGGASGFTFDPPAASTPPATPNSYVNLLLLSGTFTVGMGGDYATLTEAIADYNAKCISGAVVFNLIDATYSASETFPIVINANIGANATNTLTIKPNGTATISTAAVASSCIIRLNGADYVILDGSTSGGTDRSLTIENTSTSSNTACVCVQSLGTGMGATNNTVKNLNLRGGSTTVSSTFGIHVASTTVSTSAAGDDNDNLEIRNNNIFRAYYGIYDRATATGANDNHVIAENSIGSSAGATEQIGKYGMYLTNLNNATVSQNTVFNLIGTVTNPTGIYLGASVANTMVSRNNINNLKYTGTSGYGGKGIDITTAATGSNLTIANNFIYEISGDGWSSFTGDAIIGIRLLTGTGGVNIYYNTVVLSGSISRSGATADKSAALCVANGVSATSVVVRNNIFLNSIENTTGVATAYAIAQDNTSANPFSTIDHNNYFASGPEGVLGLFGSTNHTTLASWAAATGQDANSESIQPEFVSATNLHLANSAANLPLDGDGTPIAGVTVDYDGTTRDATTPDIGGDETVLETCTGTPSPGNTIASSTQVCPTELVLLSLQSVTPGIDVTYQWQSSPDNSAWSDIGGATSATYSTMISANTYFRCMVTCSSSGQSANSNSVLINSGPIAGTTVSSANPVCSGASFTLSLSGSTATGVTWQWQSSPDGMTYTDISGTTMSTLAISQTAATYYRCVVTCGSSQNSTPLLVNMTTDACYCAAYCTAGATNTSFEKISNVLFNTINNSSTSTAGYEDFTTVSTSVQQGLTYSFTGTISGGFANDEFIVWIDFNQDGDFTDPGEEVYNSPTGVGPHTGDIAIPVTALLGSTRMRVRMHDSVLTPNFTPCGTSTYGQVEDYCLTLVEGCSITAVTLSDVTACNSQNTADPSDDTYTADVTVNFSNQPTTGTLDLTGSNSASVSAAGLSGSHTFQDVVFPANGLVTDLIATFSANPTCNLTSSMNLAPAACSDCNISSVTVSNISVCDDNGTPDPSDDTFTADVTVNYTDRPATGTLDLSGDGTASTSTFGANSHTFTGVEMSADGGAISLTATFSADPTGCTITNSNAGTAPASCSPCNIGSAGAGTPTCDNNGTSNDPTDDKRVFTLNPTGFNLSGTYTVSVNNGGTVNPTSGTYGSATTFTLQAGSAGNSTTYTVTVTDASGAPCTATATISDPGSCSPDCNLTSAGAGAPTCDANGTTSTPTDDLRIFTLNPTGFNLGATYTVSCDNGGTVTPTSGTYGSATTFTMQAGSAGNGVTYTVTVTDVSGAPCTATATISDPGSCSSICNISSAGAGTPTCDNNGTSSNPTDDKRTFTLNPTGTNLGATYTVSVDNGGTVTPTSGTYGMATTFTMQTGSAGNGTTYTVTVTDASGAPCTATATISDPGSCSTTCEITSAGAGTPTCDNNGTNADPSDDERVFTLNPTGFNLGATYTVSVNNGGTVTPTSGTFGAATTFTMQTGSAGNGTTYTVTVTDASGAPCTATATISDPGSCSSNCLLTDAGAGTPACDNNGTPSNPTDDKRTFTLNPTGMNLGATYTVSVNNGGTVTPTSGTYGSATTFTMQSGSAGNGTTYTVTVTDVSGGACTATATISDPGSCSTTCGIADAGAGAPTCDDNGTNADPSDDLRKFTLNPTGFNLGATYTVSVDNGGTVSPTSGTYGAATTFTMQAGSAGNSVTYTVTVTDASGAPCTATATISDPGSCSTNCNISSAGAGSPTCFNNGTSSNPADDRTRFTLNPTGTNLGATYSVSVNSGSIEKVDGGTTANYGSATTFQFEAGSSSLTNTVTVTITDGTNGSCTFQVNITNPGTTCSPDCGITASGVNTPYCFDNGTSGNPTDDQTEFSLNPTGNNLGATYSVSVSAGSIEKVGGGTTANYGSPTVFRLQPGSAGSGTTVIVVIIDISGGACTFPVNITNPASCSPICNLTGAGAGTPTCFNNGTPSDPSDDRTRFTLNPVGFNLGATYSVSVAPGTIEKVGGGTTANYGSATTFQLEPGSAGSGTTVVVTITDASGSGCSMTVMITSPSTTCSSQCDLTSAGAGTVDCNNNGTTSNETDDRRTFTLNPTGANLGATYTVSVNNGGTVTPTSGTYGSATAFMLQAGSAGNGVTYTVTVTDASGAPCTATATISDPGSCSGECGITAISVSNISGCDNSGTPMAGDDTFTANVTVTFANKPTSGFLKISGDGVDSIAVGSIGATSHSFFDVFFAADGTPISLTANFTADPPCTLTNSNAGMAPPSCSGGICQVLINSVTTTPECSNFANGTISIDAIGTGTLLYSINGGITFSTSPVFNFLQAGNYNIVVMVQGSPTCSTSTTATVGSQPMQTWYRDLDNDGYSPGATEISCTQPAGYKLLGDLIAPPIGANIDCYDSDPNQHPFQTWYKDSDNDGFSNGTTKVQCTKPTGYKLLSQLNAPPVAPNIDCNDNNASVKPGATEVCNGVDDNCDGTADNGAPGNSTYVGNKTFTTQAQVNAWPACYSVVTGTVTIQNSGITNLTPLANITRINGNLNIKLTGLPNVKGLQGLTKVGGTVNISLNSLALVNLDSMHNLDTVMGSLKIFQNTKLTDCCSIYELINELSGKHVGGAVTMYSNKTTCLDTAAVNEECDPSFTEPGGTESSSLIDVTGKNVPADPAAFTGNEEQSLTLFPNPATEELTVQLAKPFQFGRVKIYNLQGRLVMTQELLPNTMQNQFRVGTLAGGAYLVSVVVDGETFTERLVVIE